MVAVANALYSYRNRFEIESLEESIEAFFDRFYPSYLKTLVLEVFSDDNSLWTTFSCPRFKRVITFKLDKHFQGDLIELSAYQKKKVFKDRFLCGDWKGISKISNELIWRFNIECKNSKST